MLAQQWLYVVAILGGVTLCLSVVALLLRQRVNRLDRELSSLNDKIQQQARESTQVDAQLHELREGSMGMGNKLKRLAAQIDGLKQQQSELAEMEPESKLYSKAVKLLQGGASIEDVMYECELPRAETELLYNIHGQPHK